MEIITSANLLSFCLTGAVWRRQWGRATQSTQRQRQPLWAVSEPVGRQHALRPGRQRSLWCRAAQRLWARPRWRGRRRGWRGPPLRWWKPPLRWWKPSRQRALCSGEPSLWQGQHALRQKVHQHMSKCSFTGKMLELINHNKAAKPHIFII